MGREAGELGGSYGLFQGLAGLSASVEKEKGRKRKNGGEKEAEGKPEKSTKIFKKRARESQLTIYTTKAGFQALFSRYINDHLDVVQAYSLEREGGLETSRGQCSEREAERIYRREGCSVV